jgi:predicted site-specific integrase-resolvase
MVRRYLFSRSSLAQWRAARLAFGDAAALLGVAKSTLARWAGAGKIAPLTDMGGKQRWFARQDLARLREDRLRRA